MPVLQPSQPLGNPCTPWKSRQGSSSMEELLTRVRPLLAEGGNLIPSQ